LSSRLHVVYQIPDACDSLFLTFDDGPDPTGTPAVLMLLKKLNCHATFFLIAEKALRNPQLIDQILNDGHTIGNHSFDHRYGVFFASRSRMRDWIEESQSVFQNLNVKPVGFRPPAGVRTPRLHQVLSELTIPLIMWNRRFFDTTLPFTKSRALRSLASTPGGSIILLHDRQHSSRLVSFLETLEIYIHTAQAQGLQFRALTENLCKSKTGESKFSKLALKGPT